jgi:hypothetical protein
VLTLYLVYVIVKTVKGTTYKEEKIMNEHKVRKFISKADTVKTVGLDLKRDGNIFYINGGTSFINTTEAAKIIVALKFFDALIGKKTYHAMQTDDEDGSTYMVRVGNVGISYIEKGWIRDYSKGTEKEISKEEFDRLVKKYNIDVF